MQFRVRWWESGSGALPHTFDRVFDKTFADAYDFAMRALRDPDRAADVVHETMRRVRRDLRQRRVPRNARKYVLTIAAPIVIDELAKVAHVAPFAACIAQKQPWPRWAAIGTTEKQKPNEAAKREDVAQATWGAVSALDREAYSLIHLQARAKMRTRWISSSLGRKKEDVRKRMGRVRSDLDRSVRLRLIERRAATRCAQLSDLLARLAPGTTDAARLDAIEQHAKGCDACGAEHRKATGAMGIFNELAYVPASNCVRGEIQKRVNAEIAPYEEAFPIIRDVRWFRRALPMLVGTSLAASTTAAFLVGDNKPKPPLSPRAGAFTPVPTTSVLGETFSPRAQPQPGAPEAPTLTARFVGKTVALSWTKPRSEGSAIKSYVVQRAVAGGSYLSLAQTTLTTVTDRRLTPAREHRYRVAAVNDVGRGAFSNIVEMDVPASFGLPSAPLGLDLNYDPCDLTFTWQPPASRGTGTLIGYIVSRAVDGGPITVVTPQPVKSRTFRETFNADNDGSVVYYVAAVNGYGEGPRAKIGPIAIVCPIPQ